MDLSMGQNFLPKLYLSELDLSRKEELSELDLARKEEWS
jgi:hypothetical protein